MIRSRRSDGVTEIAIGMPHRGRLNTLVNIVRKPFTALFSEFGGESFKPDDVQGSGDVKYHLGTSTDVEIAGHNVHLSLQPNPSHLEAVDPVVAGKVRARQDEAGDTATRRSVMGILMHGDAAFAGQGLVYETLAMSQLIGYRTGGTIHVIVNNQIGFTTVPAHAYSGLYCTDVAKSIQSPILHVNGDDPEAVMFCARIAAGISARSSARTSCWTSSAIAATAITRRTSQPSRSRSCIAPSSPRRRRARFMPSEAGRRGRSAGRRVEGDVGRVRRQRWTRRRTRRSLTSRTRPTGWKAIGPASAMATTAASRPTRRPAVPLDMC